MAFTLVQAGTSLVPLNTDGALGPALTLPPGITLRSNYVPRFARYKNYIVVVNTPTRPLSVDTSGIVRPLTPIPPASAIALTAVGSGGLIGNYLALQTYVIKDALGNDITESDYGPLPASATATQLQQLNAVYPGSSEFQVTANRLYRTTQGPGSQYFPWIDTFAQTLTVTSNASDAQLGLVSAPARGSAPDLTLIAEWQGRLWGVDRTAIDNLRYTEAGTMFGWSALNVLPIEHLGEDRYGITALAPRRNQLGVGRRKNLLQVQGSTTADIRPINVSENCGILSQESVCIYQDAVYFLWLDGVYRWDDSGLVCLSDQANVRSWFTSNSYFNQSMFSWSFAVFDQVAQTYRLFLCSAGSLQFDRWIEYNLKTGKFYGPHKTDAFAPSSAFQVRGSNDKPFPMIGSREGYVSQDVSVRSDWGLTPVNEDVILAADCATDPDMQKFYGEMTVHTEADGSTGVLTVTATVGDLASNNQASGPAIVLPHTLQIARERLGRLGEGKYLTLRFQNSQPGQNVVIHGYDIPTNPTTRR